MNEKRAEDFITEDSLLDWLKIKKATLTDLRLNGGFPFIKLARDIRLYYLPDVLEWLLENRRAFGGGLNSKKTAPEHDVQASERGV
jgi:hypothetical protein